MFKKKKNKKQNKFKISNSRKSGKFGKMFKDVNSSGSNLAFNEKLFKGKMSVHAKGFGFCLLEGGDLGDVFIAPKHLNGAFNGDMVEIVIFQDSEGGKGREGKVVNILKRGVNIVVGNFVAFKGAGFIHPDMKFVNKDVYISKGKTLNAKDGQKVVAKIVDYGSENDQPKGEIIEILTMDKKGDDIVAIMRNFELYEEFPDEVLQYAKTIKQSIDPKDLVGREDFRDQLTCTIDGEDARDFDDAISIKDLPGGGYELGVHIADVGNYVKQGDILDKEAYNRGTSVYFPDMVLPMIPKELSNGICSLNPKQDRLTLSVVAKLDASAEVVDYKICESVINSNARMTYKEVFGILEGDEAICKKYDYMVDSFKLMDKLNNLLEIKRRNRGALDFDLPETYIKVDEKGKTIGIEMRERNRAHKIIESFMILANEIIAQHYLNLALPFVYRVHEKPTTEKMTNFFTFANGLGLSFEQVNFEQVSSKTLQEVIAKCKDTPYAKTINEVLLRSLQKAKYFQKCLGHFGLASKYYCHFTSPIRRYPDLCIHRIIKQDLKKELDEQAIKKLAEFVIDASQRSSEREQLAEKAERDVVAFKKCEYMKQFEGEDFDASISGVSVNGVFVMLPNTVEGFASIENLPDDIYALDEMMFTLKGGKSSFLIGQPVKVRLLNVNIEDRRMDFRILR